MDPSGIDNDIEFLSDLNSVLTHFETGVRQNLWNIIDTKNADVQEL